MFINGVAGRKVPGQTTRFCQKHNSNLEKCSIKKKKKTVLIILIESDRLTVLPTTRQRIPATQADISQVS